MCLATTQCEIQSRMANRIQASSVPPLLACGDHQETHAMRRNPVLSPRKESSG